MGTPHISAAWMRGFAAMKQEQEHNDRRLKTLKKRSEVILESIANMQHYRDVIVGHLEATRKVTAELEDAIRKAGQVS